MSVTYDRVNAMEIKQKCKDLAEFYLPVFEDHWIDGGKRFSGDVVEFCLFTNNLAFQLAFAIEYGLVSVDGLTAEGVKDIEDTHELMLEGTGSK